MVEPSTTVFFGILLFITLVVLSTEKIHKTLVVLIAAGLAILFGIYFGVLQSDAGHGAGAPFYISVIDWTVIGIILGVMIFVEIASRSGIFTWVSIKLLKMSKGDPFKLLVYFSILTVVFSAFLDNITAMIIIGSLTVVACKKLGLSIYPYLVTEAILTNTGGVLTLVSSIPNIILGSTAGFSYVYFISVALPYGLIVVIATIFMSRKIFKVHPLKSEKEKEENLKKVMEFDEWETVENKSFFKISWLILVLVILGFAFHDKIPLYKHLGLEFIPLTAAVVMLIFHRKEVEETLSKIEWSLVFFFIGLFVLIGVIGEAGVLDAIGAYVTSMINFGDLGNIGLMWATAILSSVTANIPLSAMLAEILDPLGAANISWWAVIFGANLGGNLTPIGSASTVIAFTILHKEKVKMSFFDFVKIGSIFAIPQLIVASLYLIIVF